MAHNHDHGHGNADAKLLGRAFFLIAGFMVLELIAGLATNALVLIADAGHMFLDATALGLAWWAARISARDVDDRLSYGYHRFQVLAAFINGLTLLALVAWIVFEALSRLREPESMLPLPTLVVAAIGFGVNLLAFKWLHGTSGNTNVRAAALHVMGDLLGSAAAILAALAVWAFGWTYADPLLSLVIAVILVRGAWRVLKESTHILLEGVPHGVDLAEIRRVLCHRIPHVVEIHHLHAWALTAEKPLLTLHATVAQESHVRHVVGEIKQELNTSFGIDHSTIQVELGPCPDESGHAPAS